jgi:hypothetical protein
MYIPIACMLQILASFEYTHVSQRKYVLGLEYKKVNVRGRQLTLEVGHFLF